MDATKLEKLLIGEVSGVDDPANEAPGWVVLKSEAVTPAAAADLTAAPTVKDRLKSWLLGKEDLAVDKSELTQILDERDEALVEKLAERLAKAVEAPVAAPAPAAAPAAPEAPAPAAAAAAASPSISEEAIVKAIEEAVKPYNEIIEKVLDRVVAIEGSFATSARKSLDGQEDRGGETTPVEDPTVRDAIVKALRNPSQGNRFAGMLEG